MTTTRPLTLPSVRCPARRKTDAVGSAVEIGQIATRQKADLYPIDQSESVLQALCNKEKSGKIQTEIVEFTLVFS